MNNLKSEEFKKLLFIASEGSDLNPGTKEQPLATFGRAKEIIRLLKNPEKIKEINIFVREGTYYLQEELVFTSEDSGTENCPILYAAYPGEKVTISGGRKITNQWKPYRNGIFCCELPEVKKGEFDFDQLFVNGKRQTHARFPKADPSEPGKSGYICPKQTLPDKMALLNPDLDEDMAYSGMPPKGIIFDPETFSKKKWSRPEQTIIHIFQAMYWGNLQFKIKEIDYDKHIIRFGLGGMQMGAKYYEDPCCVNENSRFFIENIFEELDSPGEWYLDKAEGILYYMPPVGVDLRTAEIVVPVLKQVIKFQGSQQNPVRYITFSGFHITHTAATYFETYDVPSLGDWAIHRGGAVFLEGTRNCCISKNYFEAIGGNAVFINGYNRDVKVIGNKFTETGESAICLVGIQNLTVGGQRPFPYECEVSNNLIHDCGIFGKQIAGVFISVAKRITVSHNYIYNMPRAGICINDGTWGGHVIEYNRIHDTCRETGDHGPFNAWGRDRFWCLLHSHGPQGKDAVCHQAGNIFIDQMETVIVRNNFFREKSGWGLDLDDGASNYHIYNNLCVGVSMKLREGAYRFIENNIWVNGANSPCFHVGNIDNHDRYLRNITVMNTETANPEHDLNFEMDAHFGEMYTLIKPPFIGPWLEEVDYNLFFNNVGSFSARVISREHGMGEKKIYSLEEWQELGFDKHSLYADPLFIDPNNDDYRVRSDSPALKLGFLNFTMDQFGLMPEFAKIWLE